MLQAFPSVSGNMWYTYPHHCTLGLYQGVTGYAVMHRVSGVKKAGKLKQLYCLMLFIIILIASDEAKL